MGLDEHGSVADAVRKLVTAGQDVHVWEKIRYGEASYRTVGTLPTDAYSSISVTSSTFDLDVADSIGVSNGRVVLINPTRMSINANNTANFDPIKGKYIQRVTEGGTNIDPVFYNYVVYCPPGMYVSSYSSYRTLYGFSIIDYVPPAVESIDFLCSFNREAYPDYSVSDGYTIRYVGTAANSGRIEIGSYVGTGTYGASTPSSLTFGFAPKILWIYAVSTVGTSQYNRLPYVTNSPSTSDSSTTLMLLPLYRLNTSYKQGYSPSMGSPITNAYAKVSEDGKTVYWYNTSNAPQQRNARSEYHYIAFG